MTTLTTSRTASARPSGRPAPSTLASYAALDLRRQGRDRVQMFFVLGLPAFMYVVFGVGSQEPVGSANVAMYVMVSMAAYGAVTATTGVAGSAVLERTTGWGRQLALTPLGPVAFLLVKTGLAMAVAAVPVALVFAIGAATGAAGSASDWLLSGAIVWVGSALFAVYGLAVCLAFRSDNSVGIASGLIVVMAFLGNVFTPMSGLILDIGRFTPLYGYAALARYPLTDGWTPTGTHDPLWLPVANVLAWTAIFAAVALWGLRRGQERV
jgi:ABC-2 type transport system permease protein